MRDGNLRLLKKLIGLEEGQQVEVGKIEQCTCPQTTMQFWNIPVIKVLSIMFGNLRTFSTRCMVMVLYFQQLAVKLVNTHLYSRY